jgi:hypothetical protein
MSLQRSRGEFPPGSDIEGGSGFARLQAPPASRGVAAGSSTCWHVHSLPRTQKTRVGAALLGDERLSRAYVMERLARAASVPADVMERLGRSRSVPADVMKRLARAASVAADVMERLGRAASVPADVMERL